MGTLYDPKFTNVADFDCFSQFVLESVDNLVRMKQDPLFTAAIRDDHKNFADATRTKYVSPFLGTLFSFRILATKLPRSLSQPSFSPSASH